VGFSCNEVLYKFDLMHNGPLIGLIIVLQAVTLLLM